MNALKQALVSCIEYDKNIPEVLTNSRYLLESQGMYQDAYKYYINASNMMVPNVHPQLVMNMKNIERFMADNNITR